MEVNRVGEFAEKFKVKDTHFLLVSGESANSHHFYLSYYVSKPLFDATNK